MRAARTFYGLILLTVPLCLHAERKTWNKIHYLGGTIETKPSKYDFNTTLTVTDDLVAITVDPASVFEKRQTVRIKPSEITGLYSGPVAWRKTSAVIAPLKIRKPPTLFGVLVEDIAVAILYDMDGGKHGAVLFESPYQGLILRVLSQLSGKAIE